MSTPGSSIRMLTDLINEQLEEAMDTAGEQIDEQMREHLMDGGHIDTGDLIGGLRHEVKREGDMINLYGYSDARSPEGVSYAPFIENGTGIYNPNSRRNGRPWRYKDKHGQWHTTYGMPADPFIEPSVTDVVKNLSDFITEKIFNTREGGGSQ